MRLADIKTALQNAYTRFSVPSDARLEIKVNVHNERPTLFTLYVWKRETILWSIHNVHTLDEVMAATATWYEDHGDELQDTNCPTCGQGADSNGE